MSTGGVPRIPHAFTQGFAAGAASRPAKESPSTSKLQRPRGSDEVTLGHSTNESEVDRVDTLEFQQGDGKRQQKPREQHAEQQSDQQANEAREQQTPSEAQAETRIGRAGIPMHVINGQIVDMKPKMPPKHIDLAG